MSDNLLLVDIFDNPIGTITKEAAHQTPKLHRAFSVFLYNNGKLLIQKRAKHKYHSGELWANSCCSHPRSDDVISEAKKRLVEEIGVRNVELSELFSFTYFSQYSPTLFEYEFDHVLIGEYSGSVEVNKDEVEELKWVDYEQLSNELTNSPQKFSTWFLICAPKVLQFLQTKK